MADNHVDYVCIGVRVFAEQNTAVIRGLDQ